jgi:predicted GNAT family N-acyltransferase
MNNLTVKSALYSDSGLCEQIFLIRKLVFVDEQQVSREEEFDDYEATSIHYLGMVDGEPAGTARWRIKSDGIKLERFAVLAEQRKKGVASAILQKVLQDTFPLGHEIYLNAQVSAMGFYEKYGFKPVGPLFVEANIDHFKMIYRP